MGMELIHIDTPRSDGTQTRAAAINVADHVARDYPHPPGNGDDDVNAGRRLAYNPTVRADLLELLDALGLINQTAPGGTA